MSDRLRRLSGLVAVCLVGAACATSGTEAPPTTGAIVDGFPLGAVLGPVAVPNRYAPEAQALDQRMPGHAAIVSATTFREDMTLVYGSGSARSGTMTVYLFRLSDGSYHAAGVYCGVGGCRPWPVYKGLPGPTPAV